MKNQKLKIKNKKSRGVTLIELIVVLAVFVFIILVTMSIFISIIRRQRGILTEQELLNQASYATEYMSRTIRDGIKDTTGDCLPSGGDIYLLTYYDDASGFYNGIKFITKDNVCQEFFLSGGVLTEAKDGGSSQNILSDKFTIKYFRFIINGDKSLNKASESDLIQPRITFVLNIQKPPPPPPLPPGPPPPPDNQKEIIIQTTVSQMNLNIK